MIAGEVPKTRFTLDANLLIYSVDADAGDRHTSAVQIVRASVRHDCWLTLQAISESYAAITRRGYARPADAAETARDWLQAFRCATPSTTAVCTALSDAVAGRASYWDALLIATAAEAGCTLILTEDLHDGSRLGAVEIHNPFDPAGGLTARAKGLLRL